MVGGALATSPSDSPVPSMVDPNHTRACGVSRKAQNVNVLEAFSI